MLINNCNYNVKCHFDDITWKKRKIIKSEYSSESRRSKLKFGKINCKILLWFFWRMFIFISENECGHHFPTSNNLFGLVKFDDRRCIDIVMWIFCTSCLLNKWPTQNFTFWFVISCERSVVTAKDISLILYPFFQCEAFYFSTVILVLYPTDWLMIKMYTYNWLSGKKGTKNTLVSSVATKTEH